MIIVFSRQWDESSLQVYEWLIVNNTPFLIVYPESQLEVKCLSIADSGKRPLYFSFATWQPQYEQYKPTPQEVKKANEERAKIGALPWGVPNN